MNEHSTTQMSAPSGDTGAVSDGAGARDGAEVARTTPRVSIGLPVYNGEALLPAALDSILGQTFADFELIISDNASTDRTSEICAAYAERDPRIRYYRNDVNVGAARNYNRVFEFARGEYFRWAAHDDIMHPDYIRRCVEVMDAAGPAVVLCAPRRRFINANGDVVLACDYVPRREADGAGPGVHELTFAEMVTLPNFVIPGIVFGLARTEVLRTTGLIGGFVSADLVLVAEMCLRGRVWQLPDVLFDQRKHEPDSWRANLSTRGEAEWFDPSNRRQALLLPGPRLFAEYVRAVRRSDLRAGAKTLRLLQLLLFPISRFQRGLLNTFWRIWSDTSFEIMRATKRTFMPLRGWAVARALRRSRRNGLGRLNALLSGKHDTDILCGMAQAVLSRKEPRGYQLMLRWLDDPMESRRLAAVTALSSHDHDFYDLFRQRLEHEPSPQVRNLLERALRPDHRDEGHSERTIGTNP